MKYHCGDEPKNKALVSTSAQDSSSNKDKFRKDKKKKQNKNKRDSNIPVSGVNAAEVGDKKRRKKKKDVREITYYNCNKLEYYTD